MKFAVIVGFFQMGLGLILKMLNEIHFKRFRNVILEVIPQILFFFTLFGYMTFCIFYKWARDDLADRIKNNQPVPSIIQILMDIFLQITSGKVDTPLFGPEDGSLQYRTHLSIVVICLITVPWMLVPKPIIEYLELCKKPDRDALLNDEVVY